MIRCKCCRGSGYDSTLPLFDTYDGVEGGYWRCGLCGGYGWFKWLTNGLGEDAVNILYEMREEREGRILVVDKPRPSDTVGVRELMRLDVVGVYEAGWG